MSDEPRFPGINPHLNSFLQTDGNWEMFHSAHIVHLMELLDEQLPPGYTAVTEKGLQISRTSEADESAVRIPLRPDVTVYQRGRGSTLGETAVAPSPPDRVFSLADMQDEEEMLPGVVIYELREKSVGNPVTRLELLSPANKPGGSHHRLYLQKRLETLRAGLNLIELDYLHETPPILPVIPSYPDNEADSTPYCIIVSHAQPDYSHGIGALHTPGVADSLPRILIPLAGEDEVVFDLNPPYRRTCQVNRLFREKTGETSLPVNFERYHAADRAVIRSLMGMPSD